MLGLYKNATLRPLHLECLNKNCVIYEIKIETVKRVIVSTLLLRDVSEAAHHDLVHVVVHRNNYVRCHVRVLTCGILEYIVFILADKQ